MDVSDWDPLRLILKTRRSQCITRGLLYRVHFALERMTAQAANSHCSSRAKARVFTELVLSPGPEAEGITKTPSPISTGDRTPDAKSRGDSRLSIAPTDGQYRSGKAIHRYGRRVAPSNDSFKNSPQLRPDLRRSTKRHRPLRTP